MEKFFVVARVNGAEYLSKVEAESASQAEHIVLDRGIYGACEYGCDACMAYDAKAMKTDCFIGAAMFAEPVSIDVLMQKIDENNERITKKAKIMKAMEEKRKAIKEAMKLIEEAKSYLETAQQELKEL